MWRQWTTRLQELTSRRQYDTEAADEVRFHVDMQTEANLAAGMSPKEARRAALRSFGGTDRTVEACRDARRTWLDSVVQDLRFAVRSFRLNPTFTITAVATLGLGIAATLSVTSLVDATLVRPLPFPESSRVVQVCEYDVKEPGDLMGTRDFYLAPLAASGLFDIVATYDAQAYRRYTMARSAGAHTLHTAQVSANFLTLLGGRPAIGRDLTHADEAVSTIQVGLLTHTAWMRRFNGDRGVVGRTFSFVEGPVTIVGVMPPTFWYPSRGNGEAPEVDLIVPRPLLAKDNGPNGWTLALARLAPGVSLAQASSRLANLVRQHGKPLGAMRLGLRAEYLGEQLAKDARRTLLLLFGVVTCLLLICCVNVASFLVSRSDSRRGEFAVRATLGASRPRLFRQLLTEYMVLAVCGGAVGLLLAWLTIDAFLTLLPKALRVVPRIALDVRMLGLAAGVTTLTGLLAGLVPAAVAARPDLQRSLKVGYRRLTGDTSRGWASRLLLAAEAAILLVLLSGSALLGRSFLRLRSIDVGFDRTRLWTGSVVLPEELYPRGADVASFVDRATDRLRILPGVAAVGSSDWGPLGSTCPHEQLSVDGQAVRGPQIRHVSAGYFETVGLALVEGRLLTSRDEGERPRVAVINQTAARRYWPNRDPVGRHAVVNAKFDVEIVGIVSDVREQNEREAPGPSIYVPINPASDHFFNARTFVVRTTDEMTSLGAAVAASIAAIDPRIPADTERLDATLAARMQDERFYAMFVGLVALFALLLAGVGIGGVAAQSVVRRTHEIGVRLALGAGVPGVVGLVVRQVSVPITIGIGLGLVAAMLASQLLRTLLYEIAPSDPLTHALATGSLLAIALGAAYLPARRASRIDPVEALRVE